MKKNLLLFFFILAAFSISAQKSVSINIHHFLNDEEFEKEKAAQNDLENDFMLDRLEYYLSTFSLTHDGGQVTPIEDLYVLVSLINKPGPTTIDLGEFDIENLESVNFYFGIDYDANHADPSLWPEGHPLAPRFPSMHWGWAAGYRFIALEGMSGPDLDQNLEFHCIGDEFYEEMSFPVNMNSEDSYEVDINAEYANLLSDIDVSDGLILHGNLNEIQTLAINLKEKVFTVAEVTSTEEFDEKAQEYTIYPNPSFDGVVNIDTEIKDVSIKIMDALGRNVGQSRFGQKTITLPERGVYFLSLIDSEGKAIGTRRVIYN